MCQVLGLEALHARVRIQVQGHDHQLNMEAAQREARCIFGNNSMVKVVDLWHRSGTSVDRPVYDLQVEGVPPDWGAHRIVAMDPRCPSVTWRRTTIYRTPMPRIVVGAKNRVDIGKLREAAEKERAKKEEARELRAQNEGKREDDAEVNNMTDDMEEPAGSAMGGDYELL